MKILIVSQYFHPENLPINFIAKLLKEHGQEINVLTGKPNYPKGKYFAGHSFFSKILGEEFSIKVFRMPITPRGSRFRTFGLAFNYLSFAFIASIIAPFVLRKEKYDVIFVYANSPITKTIPAITLGKIKKIPVVLWVQDLWPQSLEASGFRLPKILLTALSKIISIIYGNVDHIACQSSAFKEKIMNDFNIPREKISYLPNTIDDLFLNSTENNIDFDILNKIKNNFKILFTGNVGEAQSMDTILRSAKELKEKSFKNINYIIVGSGSKLDYCKQFAQTEGLDNIFFLGQHPLEEMPNFIKFADALLISLKDEEIFNLTIPNKLQSYMASQKPIIGSLNGEGAKIIKISKSGIVSNAEDSHLLTKNVIEMASFKKEKLEELGKNAKDFFQTNFSSKIFNQKVMSLFDEVIRNYKSSER